MSEAQRPAGLAAGVGPSLEDLIAEITDKLHAGVPVEGADYRARYPEHAEQLERLLPALELLDGLEHAAGPTSPSPSSTAAEANEVPGTLGDFRMVREVGRGGMGVVYEAEQISLGRRVALKVLPFAATLDPRQLQRFRTEAQAAALLHHPHIVPVYSVGCERGVHYYAMQFIEGQTLADAIAALRGTSSPAAAAAPTLPTAGLVTERSARSTGYFQALARLGVQAAEALEHAHQFGVLHRDVKPANLLVDAASNVWITDFGLARLRTHAGLTLTGDTVGTLRYMSPEQASAQRGLVDHRTDVYSLGVTLYEALTLQPAYPDEDRAEVLRRIAQAEPPAPRRLNPSIPFDLETIVLKAMAREPERRYATAQELAEDLQRFLEHRPVRAARPTVRERLLKWAWRHKPVLAAVAVVAGLAAGGLLALTILLWREQAQTKAALGQLQIKEREARSNGERAEANFRKALDGLNRMLWELENPRWNKVPGFLEARHELTRQGLQIFQEFVKTPGSDPAVRFQAARAYEIMVKVHLVERRFEEARRAHHQAVALFEGLTAEEPENAQYRLVRARTHEVMGNWEFSFKRHDEAKAEYRQAMDACRQGLPCDRDGRLHGHLAFLLCDCQETELRDPLRAIALAQHALALAPGERDFWITLGLAHYRVGEWREARAVLTKAQDLGAGGDAHEWLLLALTSWRQGERQEARAWYEKAAAWLEQHPLTDTLYHSRREAADLLGLRWP
jgi:serine/threonine protein kinase